MPDTHPPTNGRPWYVHIFSSPAALANVAAYGAILLLLYTAGWEWPRQADRFQTRMEEQRDLGREVLQLQRENQRLALRLELAMGNNDTLLKAMQKVLDEVWRKLGQAKRE